MNGRIDSLAKQHSKDTAEIFEAIRALDTRSSAALAAAVHDLDSTIRKTADDLTTAYKLEIKTAVDSTANSIRKWVSDTLSHYCTTADSIINALGTTAGGHSEQIKGWL